ncbi:hypothetical protein [Desulfovibrio ferrophilus]|uniref:Lipoprotein n=1 Tax=Desulfovibrio ferrophilus TaxID=241368 RepID=A0A2Z6AVP3_9BACT|nr:hypothetical protein [Desulfovibrio ferrophilus]BBD07256.1 putative uncharacterized protein [Desulfovibrio ferrophilus]
MHRLALIALAAALLMLTACGPNMGWVNKELSPQHQKINLENCEWSATHKDNGDGTHTLVDPTDAEFDASVEQCMKDKGYTWKEVD